MNSQRFQLKTISVQFYKFNLQFKRKFHFTLSQQIKKQQHQPKSNSQTLINPILDKRVAQYQSNQPIPQPTHLPSVHLYRESLRTVTQFPLKNFQAKLKYNIRELFELYRFEKSENKVQDLIRNGKHDLNVLKILGDLDKNILEKLFKKGGVGTEH